MNNDTSNKKPRMKRSLILLRLTKYLMDYKWLMIAALLMTVAGNLFSLAGPYLSKFAIQAINLGKGKVDFRQVIFFCSLMIACYIMSAALSYIHSRIMILVSRKVVYKMRTEVFNKISEMKVGYFDTHQTGDILSRISYDIDTINTTLSSDSIQILTSVITVVGSLIMMLSISPPLVLVFTVTVPLSIFLTKTITGYTRPLFRKRSEKLGELNGFVEEMVSGQKTLKAYNQEENTLSRFDTQNEEAVQAYYKAEYYGSTVGPSVNFVNNLSLSFVSLFGALLYLKGGINIEDISSFVLYSRKFSGPINEIANIIGELQSTFSAAERVFSLLDEESEPADSPKALELPHAEGNVRLENVDFGYIKEQKIIKNLSVDVKKGSLIAIVGPTGAGKTTIINLLMRFYDVDGGKITLDSVDVRDIKRNNLRLSYSMVLQDTWLFSGTVFENIAYGKEGATLEEVQDACKAAGIHDFIESLPNGYDTMLIDDGGNISKGQKQLLTIARAMLLDAQLLILDEATSNVDTKTEVQIQKAMRKLMQDKTCFVIAHRLSTIQNADLILVVKDGQIIEQGTHKELMQGDTFYAEMFKAQFL